MPLNLTIHAVFMTWVSYKLYLDTLLKVREYGKGITSCVRDKTITYVASAINSTTIIYIARMRLRTSKECANIWN
jgi:hypothetical protein